MEQHTWTQSVRVRVMLTVLVVSIGFLNGCHRSSANNNEASTSASNQNAISKSAGEGAEIVLPVTEQQGTIATTTLAVQSAPDLLRFPGKIVLPDNESWHVGVLSTGRIEHVYANLGDYVHKGAVLARMHSHDVHDARATYAIAVAEKSRLQSAATLAQVNYDRMQRLYALRAASVEQTEQARQELVNAKTALENGQTDVIRSKTHLEENLGIPADLPANAHDETAELIPIVAPASGYVLQKNATPGTTVAPATDIFVLGEPRHLWMLAAVGQELLGQLKVGQSAWVTLPGIPGQRFAGRISNLGQEFDPTTRRLQVRIDLDHAGDILRPEMLATAEIAVGETHPLILIAPEAVQQVNGQDIVFVRKAANRFMLRPVRVGGSVNGKAVLEDGVHPGEEVVTQGSFLLKSQLLKASMQGD
ncbi:efflux RND transporter periplasmic adaptor subunit [Edaphobacter albus]|uniref:efflux RND transporter periplasmic adaptor subunit n=1 Tax=Edaphobacter sp. 4G125 TaxID=2763071 RepID=UPI001645511D|nr:efflux RND transporter periplasmic adaptor subunit [Edaphobacter sp. 4G125]QNI35791.1 efflux RND transporter periplasmic adaptor subunit [Edaphobacter sp. 4G125]